MTKELSLEGEASRNDHSTRKWAKDLFNGDVTRYPEMMRLLSTVSLLLVSCGGAAASSEGAEAPSAGRTANASSLVAQAPAKEEHETIPEVVARAELRPLVTSIKPGKPFWMALHLSIYTGYRVSWTYAGDVGREIRVRFTAPEGFEVGRVVYPTPERFQVGEYEAFGWQGETAAFVRITPPRRLSSRDAHRFDVKADWLSCKKECLREETNAYIELTSSWSGGKSAEDGTLDALLARVPKPFGDEKQASHEWHRGPRVPSVRLEVEGVALSSFIPATEASRKGVTAKVIEGGKALSLEFEAPPGPPPHTTYGVVVGMRGKTQESYEVVIPWIDVDERTTKK